MDIRMQRRALSLLYRLYIRESKHAEQIPYYPQKTRIPAKAEPIALTVPERVGISSRFLCQFIDALEADRSINLHALVLSRHEKPLLTLAAPGYDPTIPHLTHSMAKTLVALTYGFLSDEGKIDLDAPAYTFFPEHLPTILSSRMRRITIRHLLTMSAGVAFNEAGSVTETGWIRAFFESAVNFRPGTAFLYNSMNSYLLAAIAERITESDLGEYLRPRLFDPLGIGDIFWEHSPDGYTKGGWGLYIATTDIVKIGELILGRGVWRGRRLLSETWMDEMCRCHIETPEGIGGYNYGYQLWVARDGRSLLMNGMLGQNVWVCPENGIVIACNAGNCELFQRGHLIPLINRFFCRPFPEKTSAPSAGLQRTLQTRIANFFRERAFISQSPLPDGALPHEVSAISGKTFRAENNNLSLLPSFVSLMQNSLGKGISSLSFHRMANVLCLRLVEGDETYRVHIGFGHYEENRLRIRGERYLLHIGGEFCRDTDGIPILKLDFVFPELPSSRRMKLYYDEAVKTLVLSEQPGVGIMDDLIANLSFSVRFGELLSGLLRGQLEREWFAYRVRSAWEPTLRVSTGDNPPPPISPIPEESDEKKKKTSPSQELPAPADSDKSHDSEAASPGESALHVKNDLQNKGSDRADSSRTITARVFSSLTGLLFPGEKKTMTAACPGATQTASNPSARTGAKKASAIPSPVVAKTLKAAVRQETVKLAESKRPSADPAAKNKEPSSPAKAPIAAPVKAPTSSPAGKVPIAAPAKASTSSPAGKAPNTKAPLRKKSPPNPRQS